MTRARLNPARLAILGMLAVSLAVGAVIYYVQVYAYYREIDAESVELTRADGTVEPIPVADFRGIDSDSSPIRYRACFTLEADPATLRPYAQPTPLNAPGWFECFDAVAIDEAIEAGAATAVLGRAGVREGVDRVLALFPDGRAYAWQQVNPCGALIEERDREPECGPASATGDAPDPESE